MARGQQDQPTSVSSADMEPWETTPVRMVVLFYHDHQLEPISTTVDIPTVSVGTIKTPRDVLNYLEAFESYRVLLVPDYFVTFPEPLPMMWPGFRDRPLSEEHIVYELDEQLWDRTTVEDFLAGVTRPEDRMLFLFFVVSPETMNPDTLEALLAENARIEAEIESGVIAEG